ncbi:hypothetical protein AOG2_13670 [Geobacter sp. AOG2]|nr:hypothetical protein AOG2_13670 [Geobacter sp. AOG2]
MKNSQSQQKGDTTVTTQTTHNHSISCSVSNSGTQCIELSSEALPGWIGNFVALACRDSEAHPAAVLITLLLRFAAECEGPYVLIGDAKQWARTFGVIVGDSSRARKGTSSKPVMKLFTGLEGAARYSPGPLSTGEGLIYAVRDATFGIDKKTGEEIIIDPGVTDKRLFFHEEEFQPALSSTRRDGSTLSAIIRGFYDDGNAEPMTKTSRIKATKAHVVILGHITRAELRLMSQVQMFNGFANRFLWIHAQRQKLVALPKPIPKEEMEKYRRIIAKCVKEARKLRVVRLTKEAKDYWQEVYRSLSGEHPGAFGAITSRTETHTIRLALIYALAMNKKNISVSELKAALALVTYAQQTAMTLFSEDAAGVHHEKILQALRNAPEHRMTKTEISRDVFKKNVEAMEIKRVLDGMAERGILRIEVVKKDGHKITIVHLIS